MNNRVYFICIMLFMPAWSAQKHSSSSLGNLESKRMSSQEWQLFSDDINVIKTKVNTLVTSVAALKPPKQEETTIQHFVSFVKRHPSKVHHIPRKETTCSSLSGNNNAKEKAVEYFEILNKSVDLASQKVNDLQEVQPQIPSLKHQRRSTFFGSKKVDESSAF